MKDVKYRVYVDFRCAAAMRNFAELLQGSGYIPVITKVVLDPLSTVAEQPNKGGGINGRR